MTDFAQTPTSRATPLHHIANRSKRLPPLRVGVGGPVGSGKTTLVEMLCKAMRDKWDLVVVHRQRVGDQRGHLLDQRLQDALAGELAQRYGLQRRLHHVLGPAEQRRMQGLCRGGVRAGRGEREGDRPGGRGRERGEVAQARVVVDRLVAQPLDQRAPHLFALQAQLARLARADDEVVQLRHAREVVALPRGVRLREHRQVGARGRQRHLVGEPRGGAGLAADAAVIDRGLQRLGVAEAADRQRRRGEPHQLQQHGVAGGVGHQWPCFLWP